MRQDVSSLFARDSRREGPLKRGGWRLRHGLFDPGDPLPLGPCTRGQCRFRDLRTRHGDGCLGCGSQYHRAPVRRRHQDRPPHQLAESGKERLFCLGRAVARRDLCDDVRTTALFPSRESRFVPGFRQVLVGRLYFPTRQLHGRKVRENLQCRLCGSDQIADLVVHRRLGGAPCPRCTQQPHIARDLVFPTSRNVIPTPVERT